MYYVAAACCRSSSPHFVVAAVVPVDRAQPLHGRSIVLLGIAQFFTRGLAAKLPRRFPYPPIAAASLSAIIAAALTPVRAMLCRPAGALDGGANSASIRHFAGFCGIARSFR